MLILDTDALPVADRIDAVRLAMGSPVAPSSVDVDVDTGVRARILARTLGPSAALVHMESSGLRMTRTARHVRGSAEEKVSVAIQLAGRARLTHRGLGPLGAGELHLVDLTSPFDYETGSDSDAQAVYIDTAVLGVTVDAVRAAAGRLRGSPLYSLTRAHLIRVRQVADTVEDDRIAAMLGTATVELVRALIVSAAEIRHDRTGDPEYLMARITAYMLTHLGEADLDPARIAHEHNISVRYLHLLFARQDLSVRRWLMQKRLECARHALAQDRSTRYSIATVARNHGFTDPGHFARRFRSAYGMTHEIGAKPHARFDQPRRPSREAGELITTIPRTSGKEPS